MSTSTIIVSANDLLNLLNLVSLTADKPTSADENYPCLLLFSRRGDFGEEVGEASYLCAASSRITVAGTSLIPANGELDDMWRLPVRSRNELSSILKSWVKEDRDCKVKFRVSDTGAASVSFVGVEDRAVRFYLDPDDGWQLNETFDMISGASAEDVVTDMNDNELPAGKRIRLSSRTLDTLSKVAKQSMTDSVDLIVSNHPASVILAETETWAGAVAGEEYPCDFDVNEREFEYFEPEAYSKG